MKLWMKEMGMSGNEESWSGWNRKIGRGSYRVFRTYISGQFISFGCDSV